MKYALLGSSGFIAKRHKEAIAEIGSEVVLTCDIDSRAKADFVDYREMLSSPLIESVDAISILTPNYLHAEHIRACLSTNKKVLVEKPVTINTDFSFLEGVFIVHQLHFHPLFNDICQAIKNAKEIKAVMKAYRDKEFWDSWKGDELKSGGVAYILGSHIFDLVLSALPNLKYDIILAEDHNHISQGKILFETGQELSFVNQFLNSRDGQERYVDCDGKKFQLSIKDNLSFEGLHPLVLKAFEGGAESNLESAKNYVRLIDKIKRFSSQPVLC